jgi:hypothetical protein
LFDFEKKRMMQATLLLSNKGWEASQVKDKE